jgi:hypothetical protein
MASLTGIQIEGFSGAGAETAGPIAAGNAAAGNGTAGNGTATGEPHIAQDVLPGATTLPQFPHCNSGVGGGGVPVVAPIFVSSVPDSLRCQCYAVSRQEFQNFRMVVELDGPAEEP